MSAKPASILDAHRRLVLRAALGEGAPAIDAYRRWRATVNLDDVNDITYRLLPLLFRTSEKYGLQDEETPRIRGVVKHIWLSNTLRMQSLRNALAALHDAGVDALLLKGAALFARDMEFAGSHVAGDYDIQVRPTDAPRAVAALLLAGFKPHIVRADRFTASDFETIHGAHFVTNGGLGSLDLHWRPLPNLRDPLFLEELFAHADDAELAERRVKVPSLADHLFLAVVRPQPWEANEVFLRAIEATKILRAWGGRLDWDRFEKLLAHNRQDWIAAHMLRLIRDELQVSMPKDVIERVGARAAPFDRLVLAVCRTPPYLRTAPQRLLLKAIEIAKSEPDVPGTFWACVRFILRRPHVLARLIAEGRTELPWQARPDPAAIWREEAARETVLDPAGPSFRSGFSFPENDGRWTDGKVAVLELPVAAALGASVDVRMVVRPFFPPKKTTFDFRIAASGDAVTRHVLSTSGGSPVAVTIAARAVGATARKVVIVLQLIATGRPIALGLSDDPRLLGLFVESVEVPGDKNAGLSLHGACS